MLPTFDSYFVVEKLTPQLISMLKQGAREFHFEILKLLKKIPHELPHWMRMQLLLEALPRILLSKQDSGGLTLIMPTVRTSPISIGIEVLPPMVCTLSDRVEAIKLYSHVLSLMTLEDRKRVLGMLLLPMLDANQYEVVLAVTDVLFSFSKDMSSEELEELTEYYLPRFFNNHKLKNHTYSISSDELYATRNLNIAELLFKHYENLDDYLIKYLEDEILPVLFSQFVPYRMREEIGSTLLRYKDIIPQHFTSPFSKDLKCYTDRVSRGFRVRFPEELIRLMAMMGPIKSIPNVYRLSCHDLLQNPSVEPILMEAIAIKAWHFRDSRIKAQFILFEFYITNFEKAKEPFMAKLVLAVLKRLNRYSWVLVQPYDRYDSLRKYFSLAPSLDYFETVATKYFIHSMNNKIPTRISALIKDLLNLLPLQKILIPSSFHQFEHFWKTIFSYARENNMAIFIEKNEKGQCFLHCNGNESMKVAIDKEIVKMMQWDRYEKALVKMSNCASHADLLKEKHFNLNAEIYKKATSDSFLLYPNRISYQKSRDEAFSSSDQASSSSSNFRVRFHSIEKDDLKPSNSPSDNKKRCLIM